MMEQAGFKDVKIIDITKNFRLSFMLISLKTLAFSLFYKKKKVKGVKNNNVKFAKSYNNFGFMNVLNKFISPIILSIGCNLRLIAVVAEKK